MLKPTMMLGSPSSKEYIPTDDELLQRFLYNKIHNKPLPTSINVLEYDLYGAEKNPWEIWEEFRDSHSYGGKDLYFFTTLKKKSATSSRLVRTIGLGSWEGEDTGKIIIAKDTNQPLGLKKRFRFEKSDTYHDGGWILHEYSLHLSLISGSMGNDIVLCRFRKNIPRGKDLRNTSQTKQRKTVVVIEQVDATKIDNNDACLGNFIYQKYSAKQPNDEEKKSKLIETPTKEECECNEEEEEEEEEEDVNNMPAWLKGFANELRMVNGGKLIKEEKIQLDPNEFNKELLLERFDSKHMKNG